MSTQMVSNIDGVRTEIGSKPQGCLHHTMLRITPTKSLDDFAPPQCLSLRRHEHSSPWLGECLMQTFFLYTISAAIKTKAVIIRKYFTAGCFFLGPDNKDQRRAQLKSRGARGFAEKERPHDKACCYLFGRKIISSICKFSTVPHRANCIRVPVRSLTMALSSVEAPKTLVVF
jgi:hypothetical protein